MKGGEGKGKEKGREGEGKGRAPTYFAVIRPLSVTHGHCDARPTVTFPAYSGTKFILLGDSWLSRILVL